MTIAAVAVWCLAVAMAYLLVRLASSLFKRSRCCNARVRYVLGWNYKHDGDACVKCGMLQD